AHTGRDFLPPRLLRLLYQVCSHSAKVIIDYNCLHIANRAMAQLGRFAFRVSAVLRARRVGWRVGGLATRRHGRGAPSQGCVMGRGRRGLWARPTDAPLTGGGPFGVVLDLEILSFRPAVRTDGDPSGMRCSSSAETARTAVRSVIWLVTVAVLALAARAAGTRAESAPVAVDAAVVLAADVSRSIDHGEFALERRGYAEAIQSRKLVDAISAGPHGAIALATSNGRARTNRSSWSAGRSSATPATRASSPPPSPLRRAPSLGGPRSARRSTSLSANSPGPGLRPTSGSSTCPETARAIRGVPSRRRATRRRRPARSSTGSRSSTAAPPRWAAISPFT